MTETKSHQPDQDKVMVALPLPLLEDVLEVLAASPETPENNSVCYRMLRAVNAAQKYKMARPANSRIRRFTMN